MRTWTANGANKRLVLHMHLRCGSLSITTPVSLLANEFDVRSVLHGQVSLAAVNQMYVFHEAMDGCMRGSRNFRQGVQVSLTKKSSDNDFFLVLSLFYRSQMVNFKEIYHFQGSRGGPTFSRRGPTFSRWGPIAYSL